MDHAITNIPLSQLAIAFIPVLITLGIFLRWSLGVAGAAYALARMLLQLLLIGYVLAFIFGAETRRCSC